MKKEVRKATVACVEGCVQASVSPLDGEALRGSKVLRWRKRYLRDSVEHPGRNTWNTRFLLLWSRAVPRQRCRVRTFLRSSHEELNVSPDTT